jgi:hypothetical protein
MLKKLLFLSLIIVAMPVFAMDFESEIFTRGGSGDVRPSVIA